MIHGSNTPIEERDEARTPTAVINIAERIFGEFDVDLAATEENAVAPCWLGKRQDSLSQEWSQYGEIGWLNPPYSNLSPWINKAILEARKGFETIMLFPTPNGESYYESVLLNASEIIYIIGRISFERPDGTPITGNPRGSALYRFGPGIGGLRTSCIARP